MAEFFVPRIGCHTFCCLFLALSGIWFAAQACIRAEAFNLVEMIPLGLGGEWQRTDLIDSAQGRHPWA
jgi:hypothetical protein